MLVYAAAKVLSHKTGSLPVGECRQPNVVAICLVNIPACSITTNCPEVVVLQNKTIVSAKNLLDVLFLARSAAS